MAKCSLSDWKAEGLRFSAFFTDAVIPEEYIPLWKPLVEHDPDEVHNRPREQLVQEQGPHLNGWLSVQLSSSRVDWRLNFNPNNPPQELPTVGPYDDRQQDFLQLMHKWLPRCPAVNRLAYGANLLLPVETSQEACQKLDSLLSAVKIDPKNTRDFVYRINKRRDSQCNVEGLQINRLSTWSVVHFTGVHVQIAVGGQRAPRITQSPSADASNLCRLELDINTDPEFGQTIDQNILPQLFEELVNLANEIATEGDIP